MSHAGSKIVIYAAIGGNSLIAVTKFIAAGLTVSSAMFSEGIHSFADVSNQILLAIGISRSEKAAFPGFPGWVR